MLIFQIQQFVRKARLVDEEEKNKADTGKPRAPSVALALIESLEELARETDVGFSIKHVP